MSAEEPQAQDTSADASSESPAATVLYNSACPVCDAGIRYQRKRMHDCDLAWTDVHSNPNEAESRGFMLEQVRERLHVIDRQGHLLIGMDAFVALWRESPADSCKAAFFSHPVVAPVARIAYNGFARLLYGWNRRNGHW